MSAEFRFSLTQDEKDALKDLVRLSIAQRLYPEEGIELPPAPGEVFTQRFGAFVTLKIGGQLRGCIGNVIGDKALWDTVAEMAQSAAFSDPRFNPLSVGEFEELQLEISVLSPLTPCKDPMAVEVGRHGLLISLGGNSGLLLPQVPVEWNWDRDTFLAQTCCKAGLPQDAWRDPRANIFWFEAEVF